MAPFSLYKLSLLHINFFFIETLSFIQLLIFASILSQSLILGLFLFYKTSLQQRYFYEFPTRLQIARNTFWLSSRWSISSANKKPLSRCHNYYRSGLPYQHFCCSIFEHHWNYVGECETEISGFTSGPDNEGVNFRKRLLGPSRGFRLSLLRHDSSTLSS